MTRPPPRTENGTSGKQTGAAAPPPPSPEVARPVAGSSKGKQESLIGEDRRPKTLFATSVSYSRSRAPSTFRGAADDSQAAPQNPPTLTQGRRGRGGAEGRSDFRFRRGNATFHHRFREGVTRKQVLEWLRSDRESPVRGAVSLRVLCDGQEVEASDAGFTSNESVFTVIATCTYTIRNFDDPSDFFTEVLDDSASPVSILERLRKQLSRCDKVQLFRADGTVLDATAEVANLGLGADREIRYRVQVVPRTFKDTQSAESFVVEDIADLTPRGLIAKQWSFKGDCVDFRAVDIDRDVGFDEKFSDLSSEFKFTFKEVEYGVKVKDGGEPIQVRVTRDVTFKTLRDKIKKELPRSANVLSADQLKYSQEHEVEELVFTQDPTAEISVTISHPTFRVYCHTGAKEFDNFTKRYGENCTVGEVLLSDKVEEMMKRQGKVELRRSVKFRWKKIDGKWTDALNPESWPLNPATKLWDLDGTDLYVYEAETFVCQFTLPDLSHRYLQIVPHMTAREVKAILIPSTRPGSVLLYHAGGRLGDDVGLTKPGPYFVSVTGDAGESGPPLRERELEGDVEVTFDIDGEKRTELFSELTPILDVRRLLGDRGELMHCGIFLEDDQAIGSIQGITEFVVVVLQRYTDFHLFEQAAAAVRLPDLPVSEVKLPDTQESDS
jgi:hypothetical protein